MRAQEVFSLWELLKSPSWDFNDAVVDGRFERGGRLAGDVVANLVEGVPDGQFGGDLGDWEACSL